MTSGGSFIKDNDDNKKIEGGTDGTLIGNVGDALKVIPSDEITVNVSKQNTDLFDRLSVAEDSPLWSYTHRYDTDASLYYDNRITGTGTISTNAQKVRIELVNSTTTGHSVEHRTFRYFEYSKGRMQTFLFTVNADGGVANTKKQWGAFDDDNGVFFQLNGTTPELVIRSSTSGTTVDTIISRANWDDPMDGTGVSGIALDFTKYHLWYINIAWLGGNSIEWGIFDNGVKKPIHRQGFLNTTDVVYSQSGNLPFGLKIENTGAPATAPNLYHSCIAVFNNGKQDELGEVFTVDTGVTEVSLSTTTQVIAGIRMDPSTNQASLRAINFNLVSPSGNSTIYYTVEINGTFTGDTWSAIPNSIAQGLSSSTSYTPGFVLQSGYVIAGSSLQVEDILSNIYIGRKIDGTSQALVLTARTLNSTAKVLFAGRFREYK